jgi:hypothetical protein
VFSIRLHWARTASRGQISFFIGMACGVVNIREPKISPLLFRLATPASHFNLGQKLALYKANGIQEYWVFDLKATQVHRFVAPHFKSQTFRDSIRPFSMA